MNIWFGAGFAGFILLGAFVAAAVLTALFNIQTEDVILSDWIAWSPCTHTCGSGQQERLRRCEGDQAECDVQKLREFQACNEDIPCPVHGNWGQWGEWKQCSEPCLGGLQSKTRSCDDPEPSLNGIDCRGGHNFTRRCHESPCPIDGQWAEWSEWGPCSTTCAPGHVRRTRSCSNPAPDYRGQWCPGHALEFKPCEIGVTCPIHGKWSNWSPWEACSADCGPGQKQRTRSCTNPAPEHNGDSCTGDSFDTVDCKIKDCPVDGNWGLWVSWSDCSEVCLGGYQLRTRPCDSPTPLHDGTPCPEDEESETRACNEGPCPVYGHWSGWDQWSQCPVTCGDAEQGRARTCDNPVPEHGGNHCFGPAEDIRDCELVECPIHGGWSPWLPWTVCSKECEGGMQSAVRECTSPVPQFGGDECPAATIYREQMCNTHKCPIHGGWTQWSGWSTCTKTCGTGSQTALRTCTNPEKQYGGDDCEGEDSKDQDCALNNCPIHGQWDAWEAWSECTASCAGGLRWSYRSCSKPEPQYGGDPCPGESSKDEACNEQLCPIDGGWGSWGPWSGCSTTCGTGVLVSTRPCDRPLAQHGGDTCPGLANRTLECVNSDPCPVDGGWSVWSATACSASCAGGTHTKSRECNNPSVLHGGSPCSGATSEEADCNTHPCPIDGGWTTWTQWTTCPVTCGGDTISRNRTCTNPTPEFYGLDCPQSNYDTAVCGTQPCIVHGNWGPWGDWIGCTASCNAGYMSRYRDCNDPAPQNGGDFCSGSGTERTYCKVPTSCPEGPLGQITTLTEHSFEAKMASGNIYVELWNDSGGYCKTDWLPSDDMYAHGDSWRYEELGDCHNFPIHERTTGRITHRTNDNWHCLELRIYPGVLSVKCHPGDFWINNDETHDFVCNDYVGMGWPLF